MVVRKYVRMMIIIIIMFVSQSVRVCETIYDKVKHMATFVAFAYSLTAYVQCSAMTINEILFSILQTWIVALHQHVTDCNPPLTVDSRRVHWAHAIPTISVFIRVNHLEHSSKEWAYSNWQQKSSSTNPIQLLSLWPFRAMRFICQRYVHGHMCISMNKSSGIPIPSDHVRWTCALTSEASEIEITIFTFYLLMKLFTVDCWTKIETWLVDSTQLLHVQRWIVCNQSYFPDK